MARRIVDFKLTEAGCVLALSNDGVLFMWDNAAGDHASSNAWLRFPDLPRDEVPMRRSDAVRDPLDDYLKTRPDNGYGQDKY